MSGDHSSPEVLLTSAADGTIYDGKAAQSSSRLEHISTAVGDVQNTIAPDCSDLSLFAAPSPALPATSQPSLATSQGSRIARISDETAAAISSQQVVIDLRCICKELVENALDAGATSIEVRLMDCGFGGVEVRDNGKGISPQDLELLGFRHATSKIATFDDIYSKLDSLGFRGEALSSLCFVARVSIVTRCRSADFATRIFFDQNGKQIAREATAREVGTTVSVEDIFGRMPLRRRTMEQTKQRQLQDALSLLQRIALLHATSCRIVLSNFDPNTGGRSTFLATKGTSSGLLEAALTVYGSKQLAACTELTLSGDEPGREWRLEAVISRPPHGVRSTALQHFFVKRRAVEFPPLLQKLLNKKWKEVSSRGLFPVCLAFLELDASLLDINVRKDKQQVLLAVERDIAQALLEAVGKILAPSVGSLEFGSSKKQRQLAVNSCASSQLSAEPPSQQDEQQQQQGHRQQEPLQHDKHSRQQQQLHTVHLKNRLVQPHVPIPRGDHVHGAGQQEQGEEREQQRSLEAEECHGITDRGAPGHSCPERSDGAALDTSMLESMDCEIGLQPRGLLLNDNLKDDGEPANSRHREEAAGGTLGSLLSDGSQSRRPLIVGRRQHRHSENAARNPQPQTGTQQEQPNAPEEAHVRPGRRSVDRIQCRDVEIVGRSSYSNSFGELNAPVAATAPLMRQALSLSTDKEADLLASEILAAAVGEWCLNPEEMCSVVVHEDPDAAENQQDQPALGAEYTTSQHVPAWADAPSSFSLEGSGGTAGEVSSDPNFFLFRKDFFKDLTLVGQFNEGFIIAALRNTKPVRKRKALNSGCENTHATTGGKGTFSSRDSSGTAIVTSLFIVDQHASDEKRIFESLNAEFRPRVQPLLSPLKLCLPAELLAAVDAFTPHLTINGFACVICGPSGPPRPLQFSQAMIAAAPPQRSDNRTGADAREVGSSSGIASSRRSWPSRFTSQTMNGKGDACDLDEDSGEEPDGRHCFLTALPIIEGRQLSASDFTEFLVALASEDQGKAMWKGTMPQPLPRAAADGKSGTHHTLPHHRVLQYRPSRVWDILASKACRSAVMIGDPLAPNKQIGILRRMANLQLPFNCPHGRPTMRHLVDLFDDELPEDCIDREEASRIDTATTASASIELQHGCYEQCSQVNQIQRGSQTEAATVVNQSDTRGNEDSDLSHRQKRPAPATLQSEFEQQKNAVGRNLKEEHHCSAHTRKDEYTVTISHPGSTAAVPCNDDMPPLFSDDDSLIQEEGTSEPAGGGTVTSLDPCLAEESSKGGLEEYARCGGATLRLTFIE